MRRSRTGARIRWVVCAALCLAWAMPGFAHMFYLEPRWMGGSAPSRLLVDVKVGHPFDAEVLPRMAHHVDRFVAIDESGRTEPVAGVDGRAPAGVATWTGEPRLLAYRSHAVAHRLRRAGFLRYGEEEGVAHVMAAQAPSSSGVEHENYRRCAKALVGAPLSEPKGLELASREVECALDLVAVDAAGTFRVLFRGEPMPFVQVRLSGTDGGEQIVRSDAEGRVELKLEPGRWIVSAVHLEPTGPGEWQSWWSSFLFEMLDERSSSTLVARVS